MFCTRFENINECMFFCVSNFLLSIFHIQLHIIKACVENMSKQQYNKVVTYTCCLFRYVLYYKPILANNRLKHQITENI